MGTGTSLQVVTLFPWTPENGGVLQALTGDAHHLLISFFSSFFFFFCSPKRGRTRFRMSTLQQKPEEPRKDGQPTENRVFPGVTSFACASLLLMVPLDNDFMPINRLKVKTSCLNLQTSLPGEGPQGNF